MRAYGNEHLLLKKKKEVDFIEQFLKTSKSLMPSRAQSKRISRAPWSDPVYE